jgi:hypothetical protein
MHINWSALGLVLLVSLGAAVLLSVLFAVGINALGKGRGGRVLAIGSFALCAAVTVFGISVILA